MFRIGPYEFRPAAKLLVDAKQKKVRLTEKETNILKYLYRAGEKPVSREELLTEVWHQSYGDDQTIDVHVSWLRRKLGETAARPRYLRTVRGVGVMLDPPR